MKKHAGKLLLLLLATLMVFVLAACNDTTGTGGNGGNGGGGDDPTAATHTVHFDAAGGQDLEGKYDVEVKHGGTVESPKLNGKPLEPLRTGYDFTGWVYGTSGADFIFSDTAEEDETPTVVTDDITISATWSAKSYTHTLVTSANSSLYPFGGSEANGFWDAAGTVSLNKGEDEADPTFVTRYGDDEAVGDVPVAVSDSEDDWMVYWYYVTTEAVDGETVVNEVPFTTSRTGKDDTSELKLLEDFTGLSSLVLYPKMHSRLPDVDLTFGETGTLTAKLGDFADKADVPTPSERAGYVFDGWYYTVTTGEGEDEVTTEYAFVPFEAAENEDNADEATVLDESILTDDGDRTYSLTLYAKWVRKVTVSTADDITALRTELTTAIEDEDDIALYSLVHADITFDASITLTDFAPLFDEEHPFVGTVSGGGNLLTMSYTSAYTGTTFALIGVNEGEISSLTAAIVIDGFAADPEGILAVGLAGRNRGTMKETDVSLKIGTSASPADAGKATVYAGALAAVFDGGSATDCEISEVSVFLSSAGTVYAGGAAALAGETASTLTNVFADKVTVSVGSASDVFAGGIAGNAKALEATKSGVKTFTLTATASRVWAGGIVGSASGGSLSQCFADSVINVTAKNSVKAGGIAGESMTLIANCRAGSTIDITAESGASVRAGGIVGTASRVSASASTSSSATGDINATFGGGSITVTANAAGDIYLGGVAGHVSNMRSERSFADVDITVNGTANTVKAGASFGGTANTVTLSKCYFASDASVKVNGEDAASPSLSGMTGIESEKFSDESWLTGESNFNLDTSVWHATENGPRLEVEDPQTEETPDEGETDTPSAEE